MMKIAQTVSRMYTECLTNKSTIINNLRAKQSSRPTGQSVAITSNNSNGNEEDNDDSDEDEVGSTSN